MSKLHISPELSLPADAVTETIVVFGRKGMGKTNFGAVLAEELDRAGQRFVLIDPVGVSWGLQHGADGMGKGLDVLLLGGRRGDLPVLPTAGTVIADLVVDESTSVVVDISRDDQGKMWKRGERIRFMTAFATRFYERQGEQMRPIMLIIDEAARFVPQMAPKGAIDIAECMSAIEQIVEEGRNVGIGACLITQRSARINKSVSELAGCMVAFQTVGPNSVSAIVDWLGEHVKKEKWAGFIEQVRELPRGHALVVSPGWLKFEDVVPIRLRQTFDSSATPKMTGRGIPKKLTRKDLQRYQERMAATLEEAKANDPRALRAEVARLRAEIAKKPPPSISVRTELRKKRVEVAVLKGDHLRRMERALSLAGKSTETFERAVQRLQSVATGMADPLAQARATAGDLKAAIASAETVGRAARVMGLEEERQLEHSRPTTAPRVVPHRAIERRGDFVEGERRILIAIAGYPDGVTREQLTVLTGYKRSSRDTYLQRLRARGFVAIHPTGQLLATSEGIAALGEAYEPLPTGAALRDYWMQRLPGGERKILRQIMQAYPDAVDREELSEATGYRRSSRDTYLQRLRARELVTTNGRAGSVRAAEALFSS